MNGRTLLIPLGLMLLAPARAGAQVDTLWMHLYETRLELLRGDPHIHSGNVGTLIDGGGGLSGDDPLFDPSRGCTESCVRPLTAAQYAAEAGLDWVNVLTHNDREGKAGQTGWWKSVGVQFEEECSGEDWPTHPSGYDVSLEEDGSAFSQNGWDWRQAECDRAMDRNPGFICFAGIEWGNFNPGVPSNQPQQGGHKIRICGRRVVPAGHGGGGDYGGAEVLANEVDFFEASWAEDCHVHHAHPCSGSSAWIGPPDYATGGGGNRNVVRGYAVNSGRCLTDAHSSYSVGETSYVGYLNRGRRGSAIMESDSHLRPSGPAGCTTEPVGPWCQYSCRQSALPQGEGMGQQVLTACWANERTPAGVVQALRAGRCFGHLGTVYLDGPRARLYLHDQDVADPPALMGQSLFDDDATEVHLVFHASDTKPNAALQRVRVYHNDATATGYTILTECSVLGGPQPGCACDGSSCEVDATYAGGALDGWYFVAVTNESGSGLQVITPAVWRNYPEFRDTLP